VEDLSYDLSDIPITGIARDDVTHDLFAAGDFGVFRLVPREKSWNRQRRECRMWK
jgi:hypothetical protein